MIWSTHGGARQICLSMNVVVVPYCAIDQIGQVIDVLVSNKRIRFRSSTASRSI